MQFRSTSFRSRLMIGAMVWITVVLGVSWLALSEVFRRYAVSEFTSELDHHAMELENLVEIDSSGRLAMRAPLSDHRFMASGSGYYWQMERPDGKVLRSPSLGDKRLTLTLTFSRPGEALREHASGPSGRQLLLERVVFLGDAAEGLRIAVATEARLIDEFMATIDRTLGLAMVAIALGLAGAAYAQIAWGLRPVGRIRQAVLAVGQGRANRLPDNLPDEVASLAANVNALLETNETMVRQARVQAGNLAHALKTPLALLLDEGRRIEAAGGDATVIVEQCDRMRRQIEYQLARARAVASRDGRPSGTSVGAAIQSIVSTVARLQRDRALFFEVLKVDPAAVVACGAEDVDEMLGNVVDNAAKWARTHVRISVFQAGTGVVRICVEDDGPGLPPEARERAFRVGERLDEMKPGSGLGLTIVRDVASVYGGRAWIGESELGGASVFIELPARTPTARQVQGADSDRG